MSMLQLIIEGDGKSVFYRKGTFIWLIKQSETVHPSLMIFQVKVQYTISFEQKMTLYPGI